MTQELIASIDARFASHISGKSLTETVPISYYEWANIRAIVKQQNSESILIAELVDALDALYKFSSPKSTNTDALLKKAREAVSDA